MAETKSMDSDHAMTAILSYLGILVLIPMFAVKARDDFIKFHINQGLTLFIIEMIVWVVSWIVWMIPVIGGLLGMLFWLVYIVFIIVSIIAIIKALQGEKWQIPMLTYRFVNIK